LFKGRHFDQEIIILCVRWYLAFKLSSRDLVQMMAERGVLLAHTTRVGAQIRRGVTAGNHQARQILAALGISDREPLKALSSTKLAS
jgi:transposase-like protein